MHGEPDLLPCPFCGGAGTILRVKDGSQHYYGECKKCFMRQLAPEDTIQGAANLWNARFQEYSRGR